LVEFVLSMIVRDVFVNAIAGSYLLPSKLRRLIYKIYGMTTWGAYISPKCYFGGKQVFLGDDTYLNYGCWFDTSASNVIGDNCAIGVNFITSTHDIGGSEKRAGRFTDCQLLLVMVVGSVLTLLCFPVSQSATDVLLPPVQL
jgi:maltose O-acetyltransferase